MSEDYGDQYSEIVEDEELGGVPAKPSIGMRLRSLFGFGVSPAGGPNPEQADSIDEKIRQALSIPVDRAKLYAIYAEMMTYPDTSAIVETYAEEATQHDQERNRFVWPEGNQEVVKAVEDCLVAMQVEQNAYSEVESIVAYGDHFVRLLSRPGVGVVGTNRLLPQTTDRVEDAFRRLVGFRVTDAKFDRQSDKTLSYPWEIIHWRMPPRYDPTRLASSDLYGRSLLYGMIKPFRMAVLSSDNILKSRLKRSGGRWFITFPMGSDATDAECKAGARNVRKMLTQTEVVDPGSGGYSKRYQPGGVMSDIIWPVRDGEAPPSVNTMPDSAFDNEMADLKWYTDQMYAVGKFPASYVGRGDGPTRDPTKTVSQQDIRVCRIARRIRAIYIAGLRTACDIHLTIVFGGESSKIDVDKALASYKLQTTRLGALEELDRIEVMKMQLDVAEALAQLGTGLRLNPSLWTAYLLIHYLKLPPEDAISLIRTNGEVTAAENGNSQESQFKGGLHSLNETEQRVLIKLRENPRVSMGLARVGEVVETHSPIVDSSRSLGIAKSEDLAHYLSLNDAALQPAIRENYERIWAAKPVAA